MKALFPVVAALLLCLPALHAQDAPPPPVDAKTLLQQGLFAEEAEQAFDKAAANYERIIAQYEQQREFAVAALYRLAEVRRKQQRNDEAAQLYQRIVAEFPEADPQARLSRENLVAMGVAVKPAERDEDDPEETQALRRLQMLAENQPEHVWDGNPLWEAAGNGWRRVATWLLDHAAETNRKIENYGLYAAAEAGHLELCKLLLARGATIDEAGGALVAAIEKNDDAVGEWLIANGVDIDKSGSTSFGTVRLLEEQENPELRPQAPRVGLGERLGRPPAPAPDDPRFKRLLSPLATAIGYDNKYWVDRLLELGADANATGPNAPRSPHPSPLAVACLKGHVPLVEKLLAMDGDPNMVVSRPGRGTVAESLERGWTALHYAVGTPEIVALLLEADADPAGKDVQGNTALHRACEIAEPESVRLLLEAGADPNALANPELRVRKPGQVTRLTPIMIASRSEDVEAARAAITHLVKHGGDVFAKNEQGLDVFEWCNQPEIRASLTENHLYPLQAEKQAITLAFPHSGKVFEIDMPDAEFPAPLGFAETLISWSVEEVTVPNPRPETTWRGHDWEKPNLRRPDGKGGFFTRPVDVLAEQGYPSLKWGDIIEVLSRPTEDRRVATRQGSEPVPPVSAEIPKIPFQALLATHQCRFTVVFPDEEPHEFEARGGLVTPTPFDPPSNIAPRVAVAGALARLGGGWGSHTIQRSDLFGGGTYEYKQEGGETRYEAKLDSGAKESSILRGLMDGDVVVFEEKHERRDWKDREDYIKIIEPRTQVRLYGTYPEDHTDQHTIAKVAEVPTLFQAIAESYKPILTVPTRFEGTNREPPWSEIRAWGREPKADDRVESWPRSTLWKGLAEVPEEPGEQPSEDEILRAISAEVRLYETVDTFLPHPDFSVLRIRRSQPGGEETVIEVPLGEYIADCQADTPNAECRAKDIELQAGDTVELSAHYDRLDRPWDGFDEATARFFEKALTYDIVLRTDQEGEKAVTTAWRAPTYYHTTAGTIGVVTTKESELVWSVSTFDVAKELTRGFGLRVNYSNLPQGWIRHESIVEGTIPPNPPRRQRPIPPIPPSR